MKSASTSSTVTPFEEISREDWARLSQQTPLPLSEEDVAKLRGLGDRVDLSEVDAVYRPISRLLNIQVAAAQSLRRARESFLDQHQHRTPYIIGVAGSVAVGKSTTARLPPADHPGRGRAAAAQAPADLPGPAPAPRPAHPRGGRLAPGRQVHHGPPAARADGALAGPPAGPAGDHRRLPPPQRGARG